MGCGNSKALKVEVPGAPAKMTPREFEAKISETRSGYREAVKAKASAVKVLNQAEKLGNQEMIALARKTFEESEQAMKQFGLTEAALAQKFGLSNWKTIGEQAASNEADVAGVMLKAKKESIRQIALEKKESDRRIALETEESKYLADLKARFKALEKR